MKAVLGLAVIYLAMFLVAIQGGSSTSVQAAPQITTKQSPSATPQIDPAKDADIRALLELAGARDQIEDAITTSAEQYRKNLLATVPNNDKGQTFVNSVINEYQKSYDLDEVVNQLVAIYDKHYSDDEIKGLLQFYGTPFGQKVAAEQSKIMREVQEATRSTSAKTVRAALQHAKLENPGIGQNAHLGGAAPPRFDQQRRVLQQNGSPQAAQEQDQP
jgi:hypothetical protein